MTAVPDYTGFGQVMGRAGNHDRYRVPSNAYPAADGFVYIIAVTEGQFAGLARTMDLAALLEDDRFRNDAARAAHAQELDEMIARWTSERTKAEILRALQAASVPCAAVDTIAEAARNPQLVHRGQILSIDHPGLGPVALPGCPVRLSASPPAARAPAPLIGQHNREIYAGWLGLSEREIEELQAEGVI
jgi:crotonobetainyl-CoA:carnitine CoA-transferase CaiB-like acyl-CoA transferase